SACTTPARRRCGVPPSSPRTAPERTSTPPLAGTGSLKPSTPAPTASSPTSSASHSRRTRGLRRRLREQEIVPNVPHADALPAMAHQITTFTQRRYNLITFRLLPPSFPLKRTSIFRSNLSPCHGSVEARSLGISV